MYADYQRCATVQTAHVCKQGCSQARLPIYYSTYASTYAPTRTRVCPRIGRLSKFLCLRRGRVCCFVRAKCVYVCLTYTDTHTFRSYLEVVTFAARFVPCGIEGTAFASCTARHGTQWMCYRVTVCCSRVPPIPGTSGICVSISAVRALYEYSLTASPNQSILTSINCGKIKVPQVQVAVQCMHLFRTSVFSTLLRYCNT